MNTDIARIASALDQAARRARPLAQFSLETPFSLEDAYRIQLGAMQHRYDDGERCIGIKLGFTSRAKMVQMGVDSLIWGWLTDAMLEEDGGLVDLSREFARDVSGSKTATPTVALQGRTLTYTVRAANSGPAVAGSVTIADTLNPAVFNVAASTWTCAVTNAGATTAVPTACGAASGTGNINSYANLSINGSVSYTITAPLLSTFTGTATNTVAITLTGTTVDVTPSNNTVTVTSTVSPAATITIAKTNAVGTLTAGQTTSYTITVSNSGPGNATTFLSQYLTTKAVGQFDLGPAAAFSLIYFLIILLFCFVLYNWMQSLGQTQKEPGHE